MAELLQFADLSVGPRRLSNCATILCTGRFRCPLLPIDTFSLNPPTSGPKTTLSLTWCIFRTPFREPSQHRWRGKRLESSCCRTHAQQLLPCWNIAEACKPHRNHILSVKKQTGSATCCWPIKVHSVLFVHTVCLRIVRIVFFACSFCLGISCCPFPHILSLWF